MHLNRLWHNKKLAGSLLDNDIGVPQLSCQLLSNGGPSVGLVSRVLDSSAGWKPFLARLCLSQDHPSSKVWREIINLKEKVITLFSPFVHGTVKNLFFC